MEKERLYVWNKANWSKPVDEDYITNHLGFEDESILCGVNKRFIGLYNIATDPIEHIDEQEVQICKTCFKIYKSKQNP